MIIDCKEIARQIEEETKAKVEKLLEKRGRRPRLALVCVGNGDAELYIKNIEKKCMEAEIEPLMQIFQPGVGEKGIIDCIKVLNADSGTDAIVVHRPMPIPDAKIIATVNPRKDAYGYFAPSRACVPNAVIAILERSGTIIAGKHAVIISRSNYHGLPLAQLLLKRDATVTVCHSKTFDLSWHTSQADILVSAAGKPGLVKGEMVKSGATVIDVGMTRNGDKWEGDVDFWAANQKAAAITPVPGGVGPVALAMILKNTADIFSGV
ncbi:MAG: bifunctional 5,10-methylenetetrahydrofolate dehydrogenase/5,10-methenyltetrahydrofolate cyclohydrolase [Candidatus Aenigmatarchaeota archaeon]